MQKCVYITDHLNNIYNQYYHIYKNNSKISYLGRKIANAYKKYYHRNHKLSWDIDEIKLNDDSQSGGGNKISKHKDYISTNGYKYKIFSSDSTNFENTIIVTIYGDFTVSLDNKIIKNAEEWLEVKDNNDGDEYLINPCVTLFIDKIDGIIKVGDITMQDECFVGFIGFKIKENPKKKFVKCGHELFKTALEIIDKLYKDKYNITKIILQDTSQRYINGRTIKIANLYTLLYGATFYGQLRFKPYSITDHYDDNYIKRYNHNHKVITKTLTSETEIDKLYLKLIASKIKIMRKFLNESTETNIEIAAMHSKYIYDLYEIIQYIIKNKESKNIYLSDLFKFTWNINKDIMADILTDFSNIREYTNKTLYNLDEVYYFKII